MTNRQNIIGIGLASLILGFMACWGYMAFQQASLHTYAAELEGENKQLKIDSIQKDLDYLNREDCQDISMRVIDTDDVVKDVQFICLGKTAENQIYITVSFEGKQKNYDYITLMSRVFSVECGDDYKWQKND